jgi:hypothetical protein
MVITLFYRVTKKNLTSIFKTLLVTSKSNDQKINENKKRPVYGTILCN